jgi:hypothetical protein
MQQETDTRNSAKTEISSVFGIVSRRLQSHFSRVDFSFFSQVGKDRKG